MILLKERRKKKSSCFRNQSTQLQPTFEATGSRRREKYLTAAYTGTFEGSPKGEAVPEYQTAFSLFGVSHGRLRVEERVCDEEAEINQASRPNE